MATIHIAYERESESTMLSELLTGRGHKVIRSANGIEALEAARRDPPDLVLSDILLPKMDGFALCRKWKQDERLQSIPFIFFTTRHDDPKYERFAEELNADRFLARPSEPDALVSAIDELLARSKAMGTGTERLPVLNEANVRLSMQVIELQAQSRKLVESEASFRKLFDASPCPQWVTDQGSQRHVLVNESALDLLGYTREEFLALVSNDLDGTVSSSALPRGIQSLRRKDGHSLALLRDTRSIEFRGKKAELNAACDLTEHAETLASLERELKLQRSILESGPDGLLLIDIDGHVLDANPAYCTLTGYSKSDLLNRTFASLEIGTTPNDSRQAISKPEARYASRHRHKSGKMIDVEVTENEPPGQGGLRVIYIHEVSPRAAELGQRRLAAGLELQHFSYDLDEVALMRRAAELAASFLGSPFSAVLNVSPAGKDLAVAVRFTAGQSSAERVEERPRPLGRTGVWSEVVKTGLPLVANMTKNRAAIEGLPDIQRCVVAPFREQGETKGLLAVANRASDYSEEDKDELAQFAEELWKIVKAKRSHLITMRQLQRADIAMESLIAMLSRMIEIHDPHTSGSASRVAGLAVALGRELGLDGQKQHSLRNAALLHDIGSVLVPAAILGKPHPLTELEMALVRMHPRAGKSLLASIDFNSPVADIVEQHHERLDGSGYPNGLKGEAILFEARILGVADVVEAMCSRRAERPALGIDAALEELKRNAGRLYDSRVVTACTGLFRQHGFLLPS